MLADLFARTFHDVAARAAMKPAYVDSFDIRFTYRGFVASVHHVAATFLEHGTKRHFIAPRRATALSWVKDGRRFFSAGHFVSGITPRLVLTRARDRFIQGAGADGRIS